MSAGQLLVLRPNVKYTKVLNHRPQQGSGSEMELEAQWRFSWILLAFLLIYALAHTLTRSLRGRRLPPGPNPLPIVGSLFLLGDKPHRSLAHLAKTYGPLMALRLGQVTTVVVSTPEMARVVLHKRDQDFCNRPTPDAVRALRHHEASPGWLPVCPAWKELRKICNTQLFTSQKMDDNQNQGLRGQKVRALVAFVRERCVVGEPVDIGKAAFMTVLNLISNTLFSMDMVDPNSESTHNFRDVMRGVMEEAGSPNVSDFFPLLGVLDLQGRRRRLASHFKKLHEIFESLIEHRLQSKGDETTNDFLDSLISCKALELGSKHNWHTIYPLLTDVFVAGSDTSSSTVEWAMAELLRNPTCMAKAREELASSIKAETEVDESSILRLPYLQAVVKETLRLHPALPLLLPRRAEADTELCGYVIPRHARLLVNAWAIGRDGEAWDDPDLFMPERFLKSDIDYRGRDFELIPFGAGRRICPGLPLAFRMVHLMLVSLLYSFKWKLADEMTPEDVDMDEKFGISLAMAVPLRAIPSLETQ